MQIQVRTDNNIEGSAKMIGGIEAELMESLGRFGNQITRVEVHLRDVNGPKSAGDDKSCLLEARLAGRQPMVVSHEAGIVEAGHRRSYRQTGTSARQVTRSAE